MVPGADPATPVPGCPTGRSAPSSGTSPEAAPELRAEWVVDLTGERLAWRRAHERSAVAVRGPLTDLLLLVYGRRTVDDADIEVLGDRDLLGFWLDRVAFN